MALPRFLPAALGVASLCAFGAAAAVTPDQHPTVTYASRHDVSAPMRDIVRNMPPEAPMGTEQEPYLIPNILLKPSGIANRKPYLPGIQRAPIGVPAPAIDLNWEGVSAAHLGLRLSAARYRRRRQRPALHPVGQHALGRLRQDRRLGGAGPDERQLVLGRFRRQVRDDERGRPDYAVGSARAALDHEPVRHLRAVRAVRRGLDDVRSARHVQPL